MKLGIVAPQTISERGNPGCHMITFGICALCRIVDPSAEFVSLSMLRRWTDEELASARNCDVLILAGNPRYDTGHHKWLYAGIIEQMMVARRPMIDAWQGACVSICEGSSTDEDAAMLRNNGRNAAILEHLKSFAGVITRDALAQAVNEQAGLMQSILLPCSSWWAREWYSAERRQFSCTGRRIVIVLRSSDARIKAEVRRLHEDGWEIIATVEEDHAWCQSIGVSSKCVWHPRQLFMLYAEVDEVISYRLHAAIPAASLGARVSAIAIDSRMRACDAFGITWSSVGEPIPDPVAATFNSEQQQSTVNQFSEVLRAAA